MRTWNLEGRLAFAPDQNIPQVRTSSGIQDPTIRQLVPRNGFLALDLNGGLSLELSERSTLDLTGLFSARRYDVYDVETAEDEPVDDLVDLAGPLGHRVRVKGMFSPWAGAEAKQQQTEERQGETLDWGHVKALLSRRRGPRACLFQTYSDS